MAEETPAPLCDYTEAAPPTLPRLDRLAGTPMNHWKYRVFLDGGLTERVVRADSGAGWCEQMPTVNLSRTAQKRTGTEVLPARLTGEVAIVLRPEYGGPVGHG